MEIVCDAAPFLYFLELVERALKVGHGLVDLGELGFELVRLEVDESTARAGVLTVRLYPSDSFLCFAATLRTGNVDLRLV